MMISLYRGGLVVALICAATATLAQTPSPAPSPTASGEPVPAQRFHAHRPGSDLDSDTMEGNLRSERYTVSGNVVLHSDPSVDQSLAGTESSEPLTLTADRIDVDRKTKRYVAHGAVHFTQGTREGHCDDATLDDASHDLDLVGHAQVSDAGQTLAAQTIHYNTETRAFHGSGNVTILAPLPTPTPLPPGVTPEPSPKAKKRRLPGLPI